MAEPKPILLAVDDLLRHPGQGRRYDETVAVPGLVLAETGVAAKLEVGCALVLEAQGEQIMVRGTLTIGWRGTCLRCLDDVDGSYDDAVQEVFEQTSVDGETYTLNRDNTIDIEPLLREHVLLSLPHNPLCSDDCPGADPDRPVVTEDDDDEVVSAPRVDERWAALDQLEFD